MTDTVSVFLVDDHPVVRQGLRTFLQTLDDIEVVGEAGSAEEALPLIADALPDVVLMDLVLGGMDGIEATRRVRESSPSVRVIVLTSFADDEKVFPAIKAGAAGYVLKDVEPSELAEGIRSVNRGEALVHPSVAAKLMQEVASGRSRAPGGDLTDRELEVLRHIARGMSNKEIATELVIAEKTVKTHVSNILAKLHLADRTQAALYAVREGLADEPS
ncbi:MAG TPA: response regulator transcription factor [Actinomycetota bacterium]|nr:response regulator transcription factor [Actinomycetota bacterium]